MGNAGCACDKAPSSSFDLALAQYIQACKQPHEVRDRWKHGKHTRGMIHMCRRLSVIIHVSR